MGFEAHLHNFAPTDAAGLKQKIQDLNGDDRCHGIIIQSPVEVNPPTSLAELTLLVNPQKDVDGLHPMNMGRISARSGRPWFFPCTPLGIVLLCKYYGIPFAGRRVAILGRSEIVGLPMSLLLTRLNATVTLCHQYSLDIPTITRECDIVIVATGQPSLVQADWIKPGSAVIDVGINRISGGGKPIIVGDVSPSCRAVAGSLSPVPGGVGPMTVATLVYNVLNAALRRHGVAPLDELIT